MPYTIHQLHDVRISVYIPCIQIRRDAARRDVGRPLFRHIERCTVEYFLPRDTTHSTMWSKMSVFPTLRSSHAPALWQKYRQSCFTFVRKIIPDYKELNHVLKFWIQLDYLKKSRFATLYLGNWWQLLLNVVTFCKLERSFKLQFNVYNSPVPSPLNYVRFAYT